MSTIKINQLATSTVELTDFIIKADSSGIATKSTIESLSDLVNENAPSETIFTDTATALTGLDLPVREAIKSLEAWGNSVVGESFYLRKLGYDRTTSNDIYFQIKKVSDDSLVGFTQLAKTDNDVDVRDYYSINYVDGYNFKITIDWSSIPSGTDWENGDTDIARFDNSKIYIQESIKDLQEFRNTAYRQGSKLYIGSKFNDSEDLVIEFDNTMFNKLISFKEVKKVSNTSKSITTDFNKVATVELLDTTSSDCIGPYKTVDNGWVSANHGFEGELVGVTSGFSSGGNILNVVDGTKFISTGGFARTSNSLAFEYTGVSGNQITGITGLDEDLSTSDQVQIYPITATTTEYEYYANNKPIVDSRVMNASEIIVIVTNEIYNPSTLNYSDGSMDLLITETVKYRVSEGNIEVNVIPKFESAKDIEVYYGMQMASESWQQKVYFANGQSTFQEAKAAFPESGDYNTYVSDKAIYSKSNNSYNVALWYDPNCYMSLNRATYMATNDSLWDGNSNGKLYHKSLNKVVSIASGTKLQWRGVYTFFSGDNTNDHTFSYLQKIKGKDYLAVDFHSVEDTVVSIKEIQYDEVEAISQTGLTVEENINPKGVAVVSSSYGTGLLKFK